VGLSFSDSVLAPALVDTRHQYDRVFAIYVPIAAGVFVVVVLAIAVVVLRYRRRSPEQAGRWYENDRLEGAYVLLLGCVVAFLLYVSLSAEHQVDTVSAREHPSLTIDVTGAKWEWQFYYPAYRINLHSGTVGRQPLVVPTNETIRFNLTSADVIHAFWVPELRFKRDLTPGSTQQVNLVFTHAGAFPGQCAEFCGLRHSDMVLSVHAVGAAQFRAWAAKGGRTSAP